MKTNTSRKTSRVTFWLALLSSITLLAACSTNAPYGAQQNQNSYPSSYQNNANSYGYIEAIQIIHANTNASSGGGAIAGGLVGALLGNQIGSGSGRTVATVAGAVGGAMVGNNVEKNRNTSAPDQYQIQLRMDNGSVTSVTQNSIDDLRVGSRIQLINGHVDRY
jgi:outer membrane lipoprotein SlyB